MMIHPSVRVVEMSVGVHKYSPVGEKESYGQNGCERLPKYMALSEPRQARRGE